MTHVDTDRSFGFFTIRERLKYMGASLQVESVMGKGTRVVVTVPLTCSPARAESMI